MGDGIRMFELINSFYKGEKKFVLDIGTLSCELINQFFINGYTNLTAIDKLNIHINTAFRNYKISKNDVVEFDNLHYELRDKAGLQIDKKDFVKFIGSHYRIEWVKYYKSIKLLTGLKGNLFTFRTEEKFNIILASYVFHFYSAQEDQNIINRLKDLSRDGGLIYIKVNNLERLKTAGPEFEINEKPLIKNGYIWHLFDNERSNSYKNAFQVILEKITGDDIELLLKNTVVL